MVNANATAKWNRFDNSAASGKIARGKYVLRTSCEFCSSVVQQSSSVLTKKFHRNSTNRYAELFFRGEGRINFSRSVMTAICISGFKRLHAMPPSEFL